MGSQTEVMFNQQVSGIFIAITAGIDIAYLIFGKRVAERLGSCDEREDTATAVWSLLSAKKTICIPHNSVANIVYA